MSIARTTATILLLTLTAPLAAQTQENDNDYKTPANMTTEDRQGLMAASDDYENCVSGQLQELAPRIGDPRALVDAAMASCSETLTGMAEDMATDNYHPDFSNYYIEKVKNRVANDAIRQAMFYASQRQATPEAESQ